MNCVTHPDLPAIAYCRSCGKALCEHCQRTSQGIVYCEEHVPAAAPTSEPPPASPYSAPISPQPAVVDPSASPGLAFLLGLIPGVGAIYNGQYMKGIIHVVVMGVLISILNSGQADSAGLEPLFALLLAVWV